MREIIMNKDLTILTTTHYVPSDRIKIKGVRPDTSADLIERTGMDIKHFEIRRINFLRDTFRIRIYCKEQNE